MAYTHGLGVDQPLSITRWEYADSLGDVGAPAGYQRWAEPFSISPHWSMRGTADNGAFADGGRTVCGGGGLTARCVRLNWQFGYSSYGQQTYRLPSWHGSLIEDKRDGTGLRFRRNRYVDPNSGQFTQEDPVGLAGGLNLYGFASGDPVTYSDPFGLCPPNDSNWSTCTGFWTIMGTATGALFGGGVGLGGGPAAPVTVAAGALEGAALGARAGAVLDGLVFASKQARAVGRAESLVDHINSHLGKLGDEPESDAANGWRKEIRTGIENVRRQLKDMGTKTRADWEKTIEEWTKRLNDLTPR